LALTLSNVLSVIYHYTYLRIFWLKVNVVDIHRKLAILWRWSQIWLGLELQIFNYLSIFWVKTKSRNLTIFLQWKPSRPISFRISLFEPLFGEILQMEKCLLHHDFYMSKMKNQNSPFYNLLEKWWEWVMIYAILKICFSINILSTARRHTLWFFVVVNE
jgi:hypothetical protein